MWEYKVVYLEGNNTCYEERDEDGKKIFITLNELGKDGWEMAGTLTIQEVPVGFFKRPLSQRGETS